MKRGDMTDGIFLMHIVDALRETMALIEKMPAYIHAREEDAQL